MAKPQKEQTLAEILNADRLARTNAAGEIGMSWPEYTEFLGMKSMSTVYKLAQGVHKPRATTEARIRAVLAANPITPKTSTRKRATKKSTHADEVVSVRE